MDNGKGHRFEPILVGKATWKGDRLVSLTWFAAGPRKGGTQYNFRWGDKGPAPLAVTFSYPADLLKKDR